MHTRAHVAGAGAAEVPSRPDRRRGRTRSYQAGSGEAKQNCTVYTSRRSENGTVRSRRQPLRRACVLGTD
jgi:hypothetical protein